MRRVVKRLFVIVGLSVASLVTYLSVLMLLVSANTREVKARDVFTDPQVVDLADAAAAGAARVRQLVAQGADINARGSIDRIRDLNLLQWAVFNQNAKALAVLLDGGANPFQIDAQGDTVVHLAAGADDPAYLKVLLDHGVDPNRPNTRTGEVPLVKALYVGREPQFEMLLGAGADVRRVDHNHRTPLHHAALMNSFSRILPLLQAGAPPETRDHLGQTFQKYFFMTPEEVLSDDARRVRAEVVAWLQQHNVPVERR
jgi:ankyrin repeat protein